MAVLRPFAALRPTKNTAANVAAPPYDVLNTDEAKKYVQDKADSFLYVDKPEIGMQPGTDPYSDAAYQKAADVLANMEKQGVMVQDDTPCFYIYGLTFRGQTQWGVVGCASIDDYINGVIKKHEDTLQSQLEDRIRHVDKLDANTGPIFMAYHDRTAINALVGSLVQKYTPVYKFVSPDDVENAVWKISDPVEIKALQTLFDKVPAFYIADGHHRAASAVNVGKMRRAENPDYTGDEEFNYFLCVVFPAGQLRIMDYNRVVRDLNGLDEAQFMQQLQKVGNLAPTDLTTPTRPGETVVYINGQNYILKLHRPLNGDPVMTLDVSVLQNEVLAPILGITDPKRDPRIAFVGGIRGPQELKKLVDAGEYKVSFAMYPTSITQLLEIADLGKKMPPKSTWFEPKLKSGLFIHKLK